MTMNMPGDWAHNAAQSLRQQADLLDALPQPILLGEVDLDFAGLKTKAGQAIENLIANEALDSDRCLYMIMLDEKADPDEVLSVFRQAKALKERALPQDNGEPSRTLYVGSSFATAKRRGTLRTRLTHHLIEAPKGTFALSLACWASQCSGGIILKAWQYPESGYEGKNYRQAILAVEDQMSQAFKPMLGRRGIRN